MADRRKGDRREPDNSVIVIRKKDAIIYGIMAIAVIISIVACINYARVKKNNELLINSYSNNNSNLVDKDNKNSENISNKDTSAICNISIEGDKYSIKQGEKIEYDIKASDIQENGIVMFEAEIGYDSNTFECIVESNESGLWTKVSMLENYITMAKSDLLPSSEDQVIGKIILTAKNDAEVGEYSINLSKIRITTDNDQSFVVDGSSRTLEVIEENQ